MFNLFYNNNNINSISENLNSLLNNNKKEELNNLYIAFNYDLFSYLSYHLLKITNNSDNNLLISQTNKNSFNNDDYLRNFIEKFISIYNLNEKFNKILENYEFINFNILNLFNNKNNEKEYYYLIFYKIYEINNDEKINYNEIIKNLKKIIDNLYKYNIEIYKILFDIFIDKFLNNIISQIEKNNFIEFLLCFLNLYENIIFKIYINYFENYILIEKEKIFNNKILKIFNNFNFIANFDEIKTISELIEKNYIILLKILSIINNDNNLYDLYLDLLLKGIKEYLYKNVIDLTSCFQKFQLIYEIEKKFFNNSNIQFFFSNNNNNNYKYKNNEIINQNYFNNNIIISNFYKIIFDLLSKDKKYTLNENFVYSFDEILLSDNLENSKIIFNYFKLLPEYESFEWLYIHTIITRIINDNFDFIKEKNFIENFEIYSKKLKSDNYRLQTLINNIKIKNYKNKKYDFKLILIPSHCYHIFDIKCKPKFNKQLLDFFNNLKVEENLPKNSELIFQQGKIEFQYKNCENILFIGDILQYSILSFIGKKEENFENIINNINLNDDLGRYILNELINKEILVYDNKKDSYSFNSKKIINLNNNFLNKSINSINNNNIIIDLRINYFSYAEGKGDYSLNLYHKKLSDKYKKTLWECYIVRFLKNNNKNKNTIKIIYNYLNNNLPLIAKIDLTIQNITEVLDNLENKCFIKKINEEKNIYYKFL